MAAPSSPVAERLVLGLLAVFLVAYGWFDLLQGGIAIRGRSGEVAFAEGALGLLIAALAFLVAVLVAALLMKSLRRGRVATWVLSSLILLPPMLFVAVR